MSIILPAKRRINDRFFYSDIWDSFPFRDGDIVVATYAKSGTTWMQQIVAQLIFAGQDVQLSEFSPWIDSARNRDPEKRAAMLDSLEAQTSRRFVKSHLPADALPLSDLAKYIYVARDPRDVVWSFYQHHLSMMDEFLGNWDTVDDPFPRSPGDSIEDYYRHWVRYNGTPWWPYWENVSTWYDLCNRENVLIVHFNELKMDLAGQIQRVADFLNFELSNELFSTVLEHSSFQYMKANAHLMAPGGGRSLEGGAQTFINKGTNGRWTEMLNVDDAREFYAIALKNLKPEMVQWLTQGSQDQYVLHDFLNISEV